MNRAIYLVSGILLGVLGTIGSLSFGEGATGSAPDPVTLRPERFKLLLENERVRVVEYRSAPGAKQAMHTHPDGVVYYLNDSISRQTYADGTIEDTKHHAGEAAWRGAVTHSTENIGTTETHYVAIDLKQNGGG